MALRLDNVFRLGVKELYSLSVDPILLVMIVYALSFAVYAQATGAKFEVEHVGVGIVDEDHSELSRRIEAALQQPLFKTPVEISADQIELGDEFRTLCLRPGSAAQIRVRRSGRAATDGAN